MGAPLEKIAAKHGLAAALEWWNFSHSGTIKRGTNQERPERQFDESREPLVSIAPSASWAL